MFRIAFRRFVFQARACWQWNNFYHGAVPAGKRILRLGLDETSIQCYSGRPFGCVFTRAGASDRSLKQNLPKRKRRKCLTLIATVADDDLIQDALPMFLIGNFNAFLKRDMKLLRDAAGPRVELIRCGNLIAFCQCLHAFSRQNSAWNNVDVFCHVIQRFHAVLKPVMISLQPVLYMDSLPLHITPRVAQLLSKCNLWPCVVPPMTTADLQVPDTHVFAPLKSVLREECDHARADAAGDMTMPMYVRSLRIALDSVVFGRSWAAAFDHNGFGKLQCNLAEKLKPYVDVGAGPSVPTLQDIELCCPRNRSSCARILFDRFVIGRKPLAHKVAVRRLRLPSKRASHDVEEACPRIVVCVFLLCVCRNLAVHVQRQRVCAACVQARSDLIKDDMQIARQVAPRP